MLESVLSRWGSWHCFEDGGVMPELMVRRGKRGVWYANCRHNGTFIRDSLGTTDRRLAEKRLAELKFLIEKGDYKSFKRSFVSFVTEYEKTVLSKKSVTQQTRNKSIIKVHLLPRFKNRILGEITEFEVLKFWEDNRQKPESTLKKELRVLKEIIQVADKSFKLPRLSFENPGKQFDETQILEEDQILDVIENKVLQQYKIPCLIACYSGLRLGNVIGLKKENVDLRTGWIVVRQTKTKEIVSIPITGKLRKVLDRIKVWPLNKDDLFFPNINSKAMGTQISRSFNRSDISWASFHHFRHFTACYLINHGVPIEVIQKIMGHKDIKSTLVYARIKREVLVDAMKVFDMECTQTVHKKQNA